ncbi:hypothetical protein RRG08_028784 [Elysia crispata]|uniref:Uncharacterized protein n=1 Tax=Elysia crispata TaxID=231223 RepID=A0AAE0XT95_9GAST|nr:hypothetical protein RRG08_028784 [Elysia crispata]
MLLRQASLFMSLGFEIETSRYLAQHFAESVRWKDADSKLKSSDFCVKCLCVINTCEGQVRPLQSKVTDATAG